MAWMGTKGTHSSRSQEFAASFTPIYATISTMVQYGHDVTWGPVSTLIGETFGKI